MTTTGASNVHNIAIDDDFDVCQAIVKSLFAALADKWDKETVIVLSDAVTIK